MRDALLLVDLINFFDHDEGERLLQSFRERLKSMQAVIAHARSSRIPVIYVNDNVGRWDSDAPALVRAAVEDGPGGELIAVIAPEKSDHFVLKLRYSGFDHTRCRSCSKSSRSRDFCSPGRRPRDASCRRRSTHASCAS